MWFDGLKVVYSGNKTIITGLDYFNPEVSFNCGQSFRWRANGLWHSGVAHGKLLHVARKSDIITLWPCGEREFETVWRKYFDLDRDYNSAIERISWDGYVKKGIESGYGLRLLNQEPFETLISFIISANNNVKRIQGIIERICSRFGTPSDSEYGRYYSFPPPEKLAEASACDLKECGAGYRAEYIVKTARMVADGFPLYKLENMDYKTAKAKIMEFPGVGPKVADCIMLFSLGFGEAFPVDVWVKRVLCDYYFKDEDCPKNVHDFAYKRFGELAGLAQQYIFYYARRQKAVSTLIRD